jgi:hypothetical protein
MWKGIWDIASLCRRTGLILGSRGSVVYHKHFCNHA